MNIYKKREGRYPSKKTVGTVYCRKNTFTIYLKSKKTMKYDITKRSAPKMPNLGKGTICTNLLLSKASKDMLEPLVLMFFLVLGEQISGAEFQYSDLIWKELCGQMAYLVDKSGGNKQRMERGEKTWGWVRVKLELS